MSNPIFYYRAADEASSIAVTSEATGYPKENLQDRSEHTKWKSTDATDQNLDVDWGSAIACDYVILGGHNLYTAGATVTVQYSDDASTYYTAGSGVPGSNDPFLVSFTSASHRYWRVVLSTGSVAYELATLFIGSKFSHTINKDYGMNFGRAVGVELRETKGGQRRSNLNADPRKIWEFTFTYFEESHKNNFLTWAEDGKLSHLPFYFDPDASGDLYFVRYMKNEFLMQDKNYQIYNTNAIRLEEEI